MMSCIMVKLILQYFVIVILKEGLQSIVVIVVWYSIWEKGTNVLGNFAKMGEAWLQPDEWLHSNIYFWKEEILPFPKNA